MAESVNPNAVSLRSANSAFILNPNGPMKDRYIGIVSSRIELPAKVISPPIRYVSLVTSTMKTHANFVVNSNWLPRTAEKDICLSDMN